jgi:hypothetical protein
MFSKIGRLFKTPQQTFGSKPELFASFMTYQFLERGWDLPKELIDECLEDAGPHFRPMIKGWILVYCAWLFRLACIRQFGGSSEQDMMATLRVRLLKPALASIQDLPDMFEFWFGKLDVAASEIVNEGAPTIKGEHVPPTYAYAAALAFIALDHASPWHMDFDAPNDAIAGVATAIARVLDQMKMPLLVEKMSQHADAVAA